MNLPTTSFPGTTAPQAQLARLQKKLTKLSDQLDILNNRAEMLHDEEAKKLLARCKSNAVSALSLTEAVTTISSQSALDLLTTPDNSVDVNIALTAFEDVPDANNLKIVARQVAPVVLDEKLPITENKTGNLVGTDQPRRFTCCSPDPTKFFNCNADQQRAAQKPSNAVSTNSGSSNSSKGNTTGDNTCEAPSYFALTLPVTIGTSKERVDELLATGDLLIQAAQSQLGQARASLCHKTGDETCSLF